MRNHGAAPPPLFPPLPPPACGPRGRPLSSPPLAEGTSPLPLKGLRRPGGDAAEPARRAPPRSLPPAPAGAARGGRTRASAQGQHMDDARGRQATTNRSSIGGHAPHDLSVASDARFVARMQKAEGRTEAERPPAPLGPPANPPPPPARLTRWRHAAPVARGCPTTLVECVRRGGMRQRRRGDWGEGHRPPPRRREVGNHGATPPRRPHHRPPTDPRATGTPAPHPPQGRGDVSSPPPAGPRRPGGGPQEGTPPDPEPPAPAGTARDKQTRGGTQGRQRTAPGDSKRAQTGAVSGPRPPRPE